MREPQNMIWDHPAICQEDIGTELDRYHFNIHLDHYSPHPTPDALAVLLMVTENFDRITNIK